MKKKVRWGERPKLVEEIREMEKLLKILRQFWLFNLKGEIN